MITGEPSFQGFLSGAKWKLRPSTARPLCLLPLFQFGETWYQRSTRVTSRIAPCDSTAEVWSLEPPSQPYGTHTIFLCVQRIGSTHSLSSWTLYFWEDHFSGKIRFGLCSANPLRKRVHSTNEHYRPCCSNLCADCPLGEESDLLLGSLRPTSMFNPLRS